MENRIKIEPDKEERTDTRPTIPDPFPHNIPDPCTDPLPQEKPKEEEKS